MSEHSKTFTSLGGADIQFCKVNDTIVGEVQGIAWEEDLKDSSIKGSISLAIFDKQAIKDIIKESNTIAITAIEAEYDPHQWMTLELTGVDFEKRWSRADVELVVFHETYSFKATSIEQVFGKGLDSIPDKFRA